MSEAGEWVEVVGNPTGDSDWNNGKWRSTSHSVVEYERGVASSTTLHASPVWEKWVPAVPDVPIKPGVYLDRGGDVWVLTSDDKWHSFDEDSFYPYGPGVTDYPGKYAPFRKASVKEDI